ncbi:MAG: hypothetical protein S4CHLAM6_09020 [Chlamydiae bacterium]|nr:hypothetical protein [Chlamydiota bacterium]
MLVQKYQICLKVNGADVNCQNQNDRSPIMVAVEQSSIKAFKLLLKYKQHLTLKNEMDKTALDIAKRKCIDAECSLAA